MSDLPVRDRVQAILTLAEAAVRPAATEVKWALSRLLEALDTIDKARDLHQRRNDGLGDFCVVCAVWPCPTWLALDGGNE